MRERVRESLSLSPSLSLHTLRRQPELLRSLGVELSELERQHDEGSASRGGPLAAARSVSAPVLA